MKLKCAVCNEMFGTIGFEDSCAMLARYGFQGIEIAPFTIAADPMEIDAATISHLKSTISDNGLEFAGLHWLLAAPAGLHITTADDNLRSKSWDFMRRLVDLCGELGGGVLVLGSPAQRSTASLPAEDALEHLADGLTRLAVFAEQRNSAILIEALASSDTNIINTIADANALIQRIAKPGVGGMFDFHNCGDETLHWDELIEKYFDIIEHIHLNDTNGSYPGTGESDFLPAFQKILARGYSRWISLEIFHIPENPAAVLAATIRFIESMEEQSGSTE